MKLEIKINTYTNNNRIKGEKFDILLIFIIKKYSI